MTKLTKQNVAGTDYAMVGCTLTGVSATSAGTFLKVISLSDGDIVTDGMTVVCTFANGNTAGNAPDPITIYSSDQVHYYSDSGLTQAFTLAPEGCYEITYTGTGNVYEYISYPMFQIGDVTGPLCDTKGHPVGGELWEAGDVVMVTYSGGKFLMASSAAKTAEAAERLETPRNLKVALASSNAQSFDGSADAQSIGVSGTLPVANGGTGQTDLADVNVGSATTATMLGPIGIDNIRIGSAQAKITLEQLMTWFITTKAYIPSGVACFKTFRVPWSYANNDILQLSIDGNSYELQLAGCIIEFFGNATNYNSGVFRLRIHSSPALSFTATSGYSKFPVNHIAEYTCSGSDYSPAWKMILEQGDSARAISGSVTCSTAAGTAAKTVTLPGFRLVRGARLSITLSNANTVASALTLNVNETGAKTIRWNGTVTSSSTYAMAATTYTCYYDGTYWNMDSGYEAYSARTAGGCSGNSSSADFTRGTAYCTTASTEQAKVASMRGFVLQSGATFPITFTNANTYNGVITLNVNSTGAKNVYINNAVTSSSNKTLPAGTYLCRYNGSYYYIDTSYFVTNARNANYATTATDAYYVGSGRGAATGYYMSPSYDSTNNWIKLNGYYGTGTFNSRNSCADVALKIRTSALSSPADGDIWIE